MKVLIIGGAGMIGRKLAERLARDGEVAGKAIYKLTLYDVVPGAAPAGAKMPVDIGTGDLPAAGEADKLLADRPDVIFHLAAIVSGEAEQDFDKGYRINMDGTRGLLEAVRKAGHKPRLVFASSIAVFGAPFPDAIGDEFFNTPLTSYGTQKNICELLDLRLQPQGLRRRHQHPPAHHLRAAGQAQQGGLGLLLQHHARAAGGAGGGAAGVRRRDALARLAARRGRLHAACGGHRPRQGRPAPGAHHAGPRRHRRASRSPRSAKLPATRWWRASAASPIPSSRRSSPAGRATSTPKRALALGFKADASFEDIIRAHIEDELGGRVA